MALHISDEYIARNIIVLEGPCGLVIEVLVCCVDESILF
jgi:hypothetical protein